MVQFLSVEPARCASAAFRTAIATWKPVAKLRDWIANGYMKLGEYGSRILGVDAAGYV